MAALVVFFFVLALVIDSLTLLKQIKIKREKAIYYTLMVISFCVLIAYSFDISMPSPSNGIIKILDFLFQINA